jgi:signal transduction histidine kinase
VSFRRLQWLALLAPVLFIGGLEAAHYLFAPTFGSFRCRVVITTLVLIGAVCFYGTLFLFLARQRDELERDNRELLALREASLDINSELSLELVLQKIVDQACNLFGTLYGALAVYGEDGVIYNFVTSGISTALREKIGPPPVGKGLLAVSLREGQRLRLGQLADDHRSGGFPEHHPALGSLLAVPVICNGPFRGNLYLSEKLDGSPFTSQEEERLARFASQAAIAVDNADLHARVGSLAIAEERLRLAREMHDGQAQVLAYVNTEAQVVDELLRSGRTKEARQHLGALAGAAREVYDDVREGILGLRTIVDSKNGLDGALRSHLERWQDQCGIAADVVVDEIPRLTADVELQLLRILQEALANVRKHSGADRVQIQVQNLDSGIRLAVEDDGAGFDPAAPVRNRIPRFGLATMRERAEAIGAQLEVSSRPGAGTRVEAVYSSKR